MCKAVRIDKAIFPIFFLFHCVFFISSFCRYPQCLYLCVSFSQLLEVNTDVMITNYTTQWSTCSEKILGILWNPKVHYHLHKRPPLLPSLVNINPFQTSNLPVFLSTSPVPKTFQQNHSMNLSSLPCVLHSPPISSSLILSSFYCLMKSTIFKAYQHTLFLLNPPLQPSYIQRKYSCQHLVVKQPTFMFVL